MPVDNEPDFMGLSLNNIKPYSYILLPFSIILVLTYVPLFLSKEMIELFTEEDKIFETLSAIFFFITFLLYLVAYVRAGRYHRDAHTWLKRHSYLGLAFVFFIFAGEEISWGQRILSTGDSDFIRNINVQNETNIHNLAIIDVRDGDVGFPRSLLYPGTLFLIFTLTVWLFIPTIASLYKPARRFFDAFMPIFPWQLFLLMLLNFALFFGVDLFLTQFPDLYHHPNRSLDWSLSEVIEHGTALTLLVFAAYLVFVTLKPVEAIESSE